MFLVAGLLFVFGLFARYKKVQLSIRATSIAGKIFLAVCFLLLSLFVLSLFGTYLRGYWTTKIILWLFIIVGSLLYALGNRQVLTKPFRIASAFPFYFPIVSILLLIIPSFLGTILSYALWLRLTGDPKAIYYEDDEIRIQKVCSDCDAGFKGDPQYFQKEGLLEFDKGYLQTSNNTFSDRIKLEKANDKITVYLYYDNAPPEPFVFER